MKDVTHCARSAVMLDGEYQSMSRVCRYFTRSCTGDAVLSPYVFKVNINDLMVAAEAAKQGMGPSERVERVGNKRLNPYPAGVPMHDAGVKMHNGGVTTNNTGVTLHGAGVTT